MNFMQTIVLSAALSLGAATFVIAQETPPERGPEADPSGRPGEILEKAECEKIWNEAKKADAAGLTEAEAKDYVTNFPLVDEDKNGKVSAAEFMKGCQGGWVQSS